MPVTYGRRSKQRGSEPRKKRTDSKAKSSPRKKVAAYPLRQLLSQLAEQLQGGNTEDLRIEALVQHRLKHAIQQQSTDTFGKTATTLRDFAKTFGKIRVSDFTPLHVKAWLDSHKAWGPSTRCLGLFMLRAMFNQAVQVGLIAENPIAGFRLKDGISARITYFDEASEELLYRHSPNKKLAEYLWVLIQTGMRPFSEAAVVTADHVEENLKGQMRFAFGRRHKTGKKTGRRRYVYVPSAVAGRVRELMAARPKGSGLPLFVTAQGKTWKQKNASIQFQRLAAKIDLNRRLRGKFGEETSDAVIYSCRHTFATRMIPRVGLARTAALLGNSVKICERNYGHLECLHEAMFDAVG